MKRAFLITLLLVAFAISACTSGTGTDKPGIEGAELPGSTAEPARAGESFDNRFGQGYSNLIETEDAYYFRGFNSGFLYYYDKSNGESAVLCGKPECLHDINGSNPDCNGYIGSLGRSLNLYNGRLYYVCPDSSNHKIGYYSIAVDGSDRRLETYLDHKQSLMCYDLHKGKLYGWRSFEKVADGVPMSGFEIMQFEPKTGAAKTLLSFETVEGCSQPSLFFFDKYIYYCYNTEACETDAETDEIINAEGTLCVGRINTASLETETLFEKAREWGFGSEFRLWVENEERIFLVPMLSAANEETVNVYLLSGGELSIAHTFSSMGSAYPIDGGVVKIYPAGNNAEIWSFDGAEVYNGNWQTVFEDADGVRYTASALDTPYGDLNAVYVTYTVRKEGEAGRGITTCLVRYDLTLIAPKPELLVISPSS